MAILKRKIEARFYQKRVHPGQSVEKFIAELDNLLQALHNTPIDNQYRQREQEQRRIISYDNLLTTIDSNQFKIAKHTCITRKRNYNRIIKRLKYKLHSANIILQRTDKSKVFHLGKMLDYQKKSKDHMDKTKAYKCLGDIHPLPEFIERTNKYLLNLRLIHWISQKQYENLCVNKNEVKLAHLYYLPKTHKLGTPLRPIIAGLHHPTITISGFLDRLLRPLFYRMASATTITSGFEVIEKLNQWSKKNTHKETLICTMDVVDLYTMIPKKSCVLTIRKMLDYLEIKQINNLKIETIIRLSRFVMQNN